MKEKGEGGRMKNIYFTFYTFDFVLHTSHLTLHTSKVALYD
jgi:hypothetical protein